MKKILPILILIFTLQTPSQADDIRDFQIEGMSVGDSALDYFSEDEINKKPFYYKGKKFVGVFINKKIGSYDDFQFEYKFKDKKYIFFGLAGRIYFRENINDCYDKMKEINGELSKLFINTKRLEIGPIKHGYDKSGKSKVKSIIYDFKDGGEVAIECYDWSGKIKANNVILVDKLMVGIKHKDYKNFMNNEAYK